LKPRAGRAERSQTVWPSWPIAMRRVTLITPSSRTVRPRRLADGEPDGMGIVLNGAPAGLNLRDPAAGGMLKVAGIAREQTGAVVRVILEAQNQLLTKADLEIALSPIRTDLAGHNVC
jgi:hypothetical protein